VRKKSSDILAASHEKETSTLDEEVKIKRKAEDIKESQKETK
jgi:hypothetical protein